jgi:hypothetical protein
MNKIRGLVVAVLLGVWAFPAVSSAKTPSDPAPISAPASAPTPAAGSADGAGAASSLKAREDQSGNLQDWKGGAVAIYASSGAVLVAVIVLIILLV